MDPRLSCSGPDGSNQPIELRLGCADAVERGFDWQQVIRQVTIFETADAIRFMEKGRRIGPGPMQL
jgi:hypothetical protein